jgi:hypothetical protein
MHLYGMVCGEVELKCVNPFQFLLKCGNDNGYFTCRYVGGYLCASQDELTLAKDV